MRLTIRFDDQDRTLFAELGHCDDPEEISFQSLQKKLEDAGYPNLTLNPKTISELLTKAHQLKECTIVLKTLVDATASVTIGSDKHQAYLTLTAADGGQPLTLELIAKAIANAGVSELLLDHDQMNQGFQRQTVKDVCIAKARLPVRGNDAVFIPLVESESTSPPEVDEHGVANLLNIHQFLLVEAGTPLMKRVPATEGEPGLDVTGKEMKPVPAHDPGFASNLAGVVISPDNPNVLIAAVKGHPIFVKQGVNVDTTLHLDQVDLHSGNVTFDGSLEVKGEVTAGMTIDVTGDVFIKGGVDRAAIHAGGSIKVGGGIFGEEEDEHPKGEGLEYKVKAGLDIEAKFVHLSALVAGNNIVVKDYISHSHVKSGNQLLLGQDSGKGIVFGGRCEALHRVAVNQLGNEAYIPSHVMAGQLNELAKVYRNLEQELTTRSQEVSQLEAILRKIQAGDPALLGKLPLDKTQKVRNTIVTINEKMSRSQDLLRALEPELELQKNAAIEVARKIYPNAVMTINGTTKRFFEPTRGDIWVQWGDEVIEQEKVEHAKRAERENVEPEKKD